MSHCFGKLRQIRFAVRVQNQYQPGQPSQEQQLVIPVGCDCLPRPKMDGSEKKDDKPKADGFEKKDDKRKADGSKKDDKRKADGSKKDDKSKADGSKKDDKSKADGSKAAGSKKDDKSKAKADGFRMLDMMD